MEAEKVKNLRFVSCNIIAAAGMRLMLPQVAISTAQMLFHRAYDTPDYKFDSDPVDITSMAALFLSSKIEEYPRRARELIGAFSYVLSSELDCDISLTTQDQEKQVMEELFTAEKRLLKTLGFNLLSSYPHKIIITYYNAMVCKLNPELNVWDEKDRHRLLQRAWNYCNDSLRLDIYLKFQKEAIAFACIEMACEDLNMKFPRASDGRPWYLLFLPNDQEVEQSIKILRGIYELDRIRVEDYRRYFQLDMYRKDPSPRTQRRRY